MLLFLYCALLLTVLTGVKTQSYSPSIYSNAKSFSPTKVPFEEKNESVPTMSSAAYWFIAPVKIYPNSQYSLMVTVKNTEKPTDIEIRIATIETPREWSASAKDYLNNNESKIIQLQVGDWLGKKCTLEIKGKGGISLEHKAKLLLQTMQPMTYIQMDKPMYKPGDMIKFRSVSIDQDLLPVPGLQLSSMIKDPEGNVMKTLTNLTPENSIVSNEFLLPDKPVLGEWSLDISANNRTISKFFEVGEYVMPLFNVKISTPSVITVKDSKIPVTINAIDKDGKTVTGWLELKVSKFFGPGETVYETKSIVKGKTDIELDMKDLINEKTGYTPYLNINATVKDDLSGQSYSKTKFIWVHKSPYKMALIQKKDKYIPGLEYVVFVQVLYQDGTPVKNNGPPVKIQVANEVGSKVQDDVSSVPVDGIARVCFNTSTFGTSSINLNGKYEDLESKLGVFGPVDMERGFIQAQDHSDEIRKHYLVGETAKFRVDSSHAMEDLFYQIVHRKGVSSYHIKVNKSKQFMLSIPVTGAMVPRSILVVHTMDHLNTLVDKVSLLAYYDFTNDVNVKFSSREVIAGKNVTIEIQSKPRSTVGLLAIDQRLTLLKTGNDLDKKALFEDMEDNDDYEDDEPFAFLFPNKIASSFRGAGLRIFTNVDYRQEKRIIRCPSGDVYVNLYDMIKKPTLRLRRDFPDTWIWSTFDTDANGYLKFATVVPDTITTWVLSAFSMSSKTGLAIGNKETLKVIKGHPSIPSIRIDLNVIE